MANKVLIQGGVRRDKRKEKVDKMAAAILLQSYLDWECEFTRLTRMNTDEHRSESLKRIRNSRILLAAIVQFASASILCDLWLIFLVER